MEDRVKHWNKMSDMEKIIASGYSGTPELKHDEKMNFLGHFRERVLKAITIEQVKEKGIYQEIETSLQDPRADEMVINGIVGVDAILKYEKVAHSYQKKVTTIHDSQLKGDIGLVVVGKDALDIKDIMVPQRK